MTVEMKQKRTLMVFSIVVMVALASSLMVFAKTPQAQAINSAVFRGTNEKSVKATSVQMQKSRKAVQAVKNNAIRKSCVPQAESLLEATEEISLDDVSPETVAEKVALYEALPEEEKVPQRGVWIVYTRGLAWQQNTLPTLTAEIPEGEPVALRMIARAIWNTEDFILYKISRTVIGVNGQRYKIDGYALYLKETAMFLLSLEGDGVSAFCAIGKIYPPAADCVKCCRALRVAMKGKMTVEDVDYVFAMRGYAHRLWFRRCIAKPIVKPTPLTTEA